MNPSSSLHWLNIAVSRPEHQPAPNSPVSSVLRTILPVSAETVNYSRWKLAAMALVALPIVVWLAVALLN